MTARLMCSTSSGSTGRPKGVVVSHRAVVALWSALRTVVGEPPGGRWRVSLNAPLTFDASVKQWTQLLSGHTVVVIPEAARLFPSRLVALLRIERVDLVDVTPSQLRAWLEAGLEEDPPRCVLVGGEAIDRALWRRLVGMAGTRFLNVYGPTECTVDATSCVVEGDGEPSLGTPLEGVRAYVLDPAGDPVVEGVAGELFLAGATLARGYLRDPARTAERFLPDPHGLPGARMYRTGDLVSRQQSGSLRFLGRLDHQVKLRGFRIELGEIEACLHTCPGVAAAAAAVHEDAALRTRLAAYVVPRDGAALDRDRVRSHLEAHLPPYMVPGAFFFLPRLPMTASGRSTAGPCGRTGRRLPPAGRPTTPRGSSPDEGRLVQRAGQPGLSSAATPPTRRGDRLSGEAGLDSVVCSSNFRTGGTSLSTRSASG